MNSKESAEQKEKVYNALLDAIQRSPFFDKIPLPAVLDNPLEELIHKYKYDTLDKKYHPTFDPKPSEETNVNKEESEEEMPSILINKNIRNKVKQLKKRIEKKPAKTII
jgi:hypothetical protein